MLNQEDNPVNEINLPLMVEQVPLDDDRSNVRIRNDDIMPQHSGTECPIILPATFPLIIDQVPLDVDWSNVGDDDIIPQNSRIEVPITFDAEHESLDDEWPIDTEETTEIPVEHESLDDEWPIDTGETTEHESLDDEWPIDTGETTEIPVEHESLDDEWSFDTGETTEIPVEHVPLIVDWENYNDAVTEVPITFENASLHDWSDFRDEDIRQQHSAIRAIEAEKIPFVGDKERLSSLEVEYHSGSPILLEKIKVLSEQFDAIRRVRGDGNCFFRAFMFSYLEHVLVSQDRDEVNRIKAKIEECRDTLLNLGHQDLTFEDFFELFLEQLDCVLQGNDASIRFFSFDDLVGRSRDQSVSDSIVMFFRFITSGEIRKRLEFFEPFVLGMTNGTVEQFCRTSVEPMGEESDHVHITALSDALGVAIRVKYLDQSIGFEKYGGYITVNHHDFIPTNNDGGSPPPPPSEEGYDSFNKKPPFITLLYRPGHYDVLYNSNDNEK